MLFPRLESWIAACLPTCFQYQVILLLIPQGPAQKPHAQGHMPDFPTIPRAKCSPGSQPTSVMLDTPPLLPERGSQILLNSHRPGEALLGVPGPAPDLTDDLHVWVQGTAKLAKRPSPTHQLPILFSFGNQSSKQESTSPINASRPSILPST